MKNFIAKVLGFLARVFGVMDRINDGYHTFHELYSHRFALFAALCSIYRADSWRSLRHSDGTEVEGYFIAGLFTKAGTQITYHIPMKHWDLFDFAQTWEFAPIFDGHTSSDVILRIRALVTGIIGNNAIKNADPERISLLSESGLNRRVIEDKSARVALDSVLQYLKGKEGSRERSLSITNIQQAIMWLGMDLKAANEPSPYPNSYDVTNDVVEPTADGLKM